MNDKHDMIDTTGTRFLIRLLPSSFSPQHVQVSPGDLVQWLPGDGPHTVTSGTGAADPEAGKLWDKVLMPGRPALVRQFKTVGRFDYFCRYHEVLGMAGSVTVVNSMKQD